jgi:hypothetical protein
MEPPTGAYYYLRDLIEALSQRWSTYVIGYDLHKQVRLFDDVSRRYEKLRGKAGVNKGLLERLTRGPVVAAALLAGLAMAYALWRRRQRRADKPRDRAEAGRPFDPNTQIVVALFQSLESALHTAGITRAPCVPPLRHAEELHARHHPLGPEVLSLTHVYLDTRFGGTALTEPVRHDFERRIRDIRTPHRKSPSARPSPATPGASG